MTQKPTKFQLDNKNYYYIGAEVSKYLNLTNGRLYKLYPGLYKRQINKQERQVIIDKGYKITKLPTAKILLLRANEIDEIFGGQGDKYKEDTSEITNLEQEITIDQKSGLCNKMKNMSDLLKNLTKNFETHKKSTDEEIAHLKKQIEKLSSKSR